MNKKVLVLTLALVVAFASSAMAAVTFSGEFSTTAKQENFKVFTKGYTLTPSLSITIKGAAENKTEDVTNWDFSGGINLVNSEFKLGKYKLGLYDDYFKAWVWGNGQELSDKATYFGMISAGKAAASTGIRARVEVPVMDLATVTADFDNDNVRAFVNGTVEGFDLGVAYARTDWTTAASNVIVGQVGTKVPAGDLSVGLKAAAGFKLGDKLGYALGFSADSQVTTQLKLDGSVTHGSEDWNSVGITAKNTVLKANATYAETDYQVTAGVTHTMVKGAAKGSNELTLGAKYRMSTEVGYGDLFSGDHWFKSTAPAFGVSAKFVDVAFDNVRVDATAPVVEDLVWVKAYATLAKGSKYTAGVLGRIIPFDKLTLLPSVDYKSADKSTDVKLVANYKIGASATTLGLTLQKVFNEAKDGAELIQATIKVPF